MAFAIWNYIHCTFSTLVVGVLLWDVVYQTHLHYQLHQARITANTNGTVTMHIDNKHHIEILIMLRLFMTTEALQSLQQPLEIIHAPTTRTRRAFFIPVSQANHCGHIYDLELYQVLILVLDFILVGR